ncbi:unnamed protein product, partial [Owenia fusiformis]
MLSSTTTMEGVPDKELNDLLDFSAMFSPPNAMGKGPMPVPPNPTNGNMDPLYYNKQALDNGNTWESNNQTSPNYQTSSRYIEGGGTQSFNGQLNDMQHPFATGQNGDMPALMNKNDPYRYPPSREPGIPAQGMMSNNMPMSPPDSISPTGGKPGSPYYMMNKRNEGRGGKFTPTPQNTDPKNRRKSGGSVYSPSPDEFNQDSPRYTSPKPGSLYGPGSEYFQVGPESSHGAPPGGSWQNDNVIPSSYPSSHPPPQSSYTPNMHSENVPNTHYMPTPNALSMSSLPSMSSFQPTTTMSSTQSYTGTSPPINGSDLPNQGSSQTRDVMRNALASIYSAPTDHPSGNYSSTSSTPVSSPPPMPGTGQTSQWPRSSQSTTSPFESHLHSLQSVGEDDQFNDAITNVLRDQTEKSFNLPQQSRMEERLDDAIHVLRTHAGEAIPGGMGSHISHTMPHMMSHSNGIMGNMNSVYPPPMGMPGHIDSSHMPSNHLGQPHPSQLSEDRGRNTLTSSQTSEPTYSALRTESEQNSSTDGNIKIEKIDNENEKISEKDEKPGTVLTSGGSVTSQAPGSAVTTTAPAAKRARSIKNQSGDDAEEPEDIDQDKKVRRQTNNQRERLRVRDINEAFKELTHMVTIHVGSQQPLTKLMTLQHAVTVITQLEGQVRERNLNPKAACLKRREEEKTEELPGRAPLGPDELAQQVAQQQAMS